VRGVHESLGGLAVHARQTDVEASREAEDAMRRSQVDLGVNGHVSRQRDLLFAGDELDRREKARRPTGREQPTARRTRLERATARSVVWLFHGVRLLRVSSALRAHLDAGRCAGHEAGEALAQKEAGPVRTRLCCRHRDVQTVRDFGHRQALDVVQDGHGTVVVR
jgi:hypothetical protein